MEKHSLHVQNTKDNNIRQRTPVWQLRLQKLLLGTRNQEPVLFSRTSTSQRIDGSDESNAVEGHQSSTGGGKRRMVGGTTKCKDSDRRDAVQTHLRYRSSNTSWGRSYQHEKRGFLGRWKQQSTESQPGLLGWNKRRIISKDGKLSAKDDRVLQQESEAQKT